MTDLRSGLLAARELGPSALLSYATYRLGLATGRIQSRTRAVAWDDRPFEHWLRREVPHDPAGYAAYRIRKTGPRFFFDAGTAGLPWQPEQPVPEALRQEADDIAQGRFRLFGGPPLDLGFPPDWFAFPPPLSGGPPLNAMEHWSRIPLNTQGVDARLVWELSRFGWVFPLARAYRWVGEPRYAEACWRLIDDWRRANPPNRGVHWASAQEVGLRILALAFAERVFFPAWAEKPERLQRLGQLVAFHAARIPPTLSYAQAQNNNHLISEAAGLYTAGLLFPEFVESDHWRDLGRGLLVSAFDRQVFDDGGYVQHSANYQRLALSLGVWSARLAEINDEPLPDRTRQAIARLARSLAAQADAESGRTPSFGPDDASDIISLATVDSGDVRPMTAAAAGLALREAWYQPGPWDETSLWLGIGRGTRTDPARPPSLPDTGLHYLEARQARTSLRCVKFHERPGHSDQLHIDLWWRGHLLTFDPGSYLYNGPPPWEDGLAGAIVHNVPVLDGEEPMRRAGRFLWAGRAQGTFKGRQDEGGTRRMRAVHDGYRRLGLTVSRTVTLFDDGGWLVEDGVLPTRGAGRGDSRRRLTVGWNLPDVPWEWAAGELRLSVDGGSPRFGWDACSKEDVRAGLVRAGEWIAGNPADGPIALWGWTSPRYSAIVPCLRLVLEVRGKPPLCLRTRLSPEGGWPKSLVQAWEDGPRISASPSRRTTVG